MARWHGYYLMLMLFAATAFFAAAQQPQEDLEPQRVRLQAIRRNAEAYARLREQWNAFQNQSDKKREAVKKLDQELHAFEPGKQERLERVLARYADWLDRLKKTDPNAFNAIANAPDGNARLTLVKEQRDREWMESQPKAYREQWAKLQGEARAKFVAERRQEERIRSQHWLVASRFWKELETNKALPARMADFGYKKAKKDKTDSGKGKEFVETNPVKDYVDNYLVQNLTPADLKRLDDAEGRWPDYPMVLVSLASRHPTAMPPVKLPMKFEDLPKPVRSRFEKSKDTAKIFKAKNEIVRYEGPNFASKFAEIAAREKVTFGKQPDGNEYMVANFKYLTPPMQSFVTKELMPAMKDDAADERKLIASEGKWPEYPKMIQELAIKYHLHAPWHILPDADRFHWDRYRTDRFVAPEPEKKDEKEAE